MRCKRSAFKLPNRAHTLKTALSDKLFKGKTIIVTGPRQVGKTTLLKTVLDDRKYLFLDGDDPLVRTQLTNPNTREIAAILGNAKLVFIDKAQRIENIGITAKIIHDQFKDVQLLMSGSSAFELRNHTNESLTGRKWEYHLYPVSYEELEKSTSFLDARKDLATRLIFGFYPDVINNPGEERSILTEITQSYLYKDILAYGNIKKPEVLEKVLRALAFQVGNEVSYNEIAQLNGIRKQRPQYLIFLSKVMMLQYQ